MHKKGARLRKNLLQPLTDVVSINRRQNIRKRIGTIVLLGKLSAPVVGNSDRPDCGRSRPKQGHVHVFER